MQNLYTSITYERCRLILALLSRMKSARAGTMTTATQTVNSIRLRLGVLVRLIESAEQALARADGSGGDQEITRCRRALEQLDRERRELEIALHEAMARST